MRRFLGGRRSLTRRVFVALVGGQVAFAMVLGLTVATYSTVLIAKQRERALTQVSATIAAGLMPMIADQQEPQVRAQLESVIAAAGVEYVNAICVNDAAGERLACQGDWQHGLTDPRVDPGPLSLLSEDQVVEQPVVVDGLRVATVRVRFEPPGFGPLRTPAFATMVGLLCSIAISVPWAAWRLMRDVTEPLDQLGHYASQVASGHFEPDEATYEPTEIHELHQALTTMAMQLRDRDQRLRHSYDELTQAYSSLEQANKQIEQLSLVKSNFVAVAAHEIRSPLSTIRIYSELLETGEMGDMEQPIAEAIDAISSASNRLVSIVSDLMDAALLERGLLPIEFGRVAVYRLLAEAVKDAGVLGRSRAISVHLDESAPDIEIRADAARLRQVLDNLLSNAIKYSPEGSPLIVRSSARAGHLEIHVVDRGRGIPEGREDDLFALFGRLDFGDSRDTAGLGLGLAISARIVEAHGGTLSYRSNGDGPGSTFVITLPIDGPSESVSDFIAVAS